MVDHTMVGLVCPDGQNGVPHHGSLLEKREEGEEKRNETMTKAMQSIGQVKLHAHGRHCATFKMVNYSLT